MKLPKVSIIVPIYNVEQYLHRCLSTIAQQTYKGDIECILVDDCGTDNSIALAKQFIDAYTGHILFSIISHKHNRGLSAARNTGFDHSTGDYVYFLDSDDEITPNCIERLVEPLSTETFDVVLGDFEVIGFNGTFSVNLKLDKSQNMYGTDIFKSFITHDIYMMAWNKLCNRNFIKQHHLYFCEGIIHEDELWSFELFYETTKISIVKEVTYIYKIRNNSITTNKSFKSTIDAFVKIQQGFFDRIAHTHPNQEEGYNYALSWGHRTLRLAKQTNDSKILRNTYLKIHKATYPHLRGFNLKLFDLKRFKYLHYYLPCYIGYLFIRLRLAIQYKFTKQQ